MQFHSHKLIWCLPSHGQINSTLRPHVHLFQLQFLLVQPNNVYFSMKLQINRRHAMKGRLLRHNRQVKYILCWLGRIGQPKRRRGILNGRRLSRQEGRAPKVEHHYNIPVNPHRRPTFLSGTVFRPDKLKGQAANQ
jgi:hypothetical protein